MQALMSAVVNCAYRTGYRILFASAVVSACAPVQSAEIPVVPTSTAAAPAATDVWMQTGPEGGYILALTIDPRTPATLYVGTDGGVFKSMDGGETWSAINTGLTNDDVRALAMNATTPNILHAGTSAGLFSMTVSR